MNSTKAVNWFRYKGLGDAAAGKAARTFVLLAAGDPTAQSEQGSTNGKKTIPPKPSAKAAAAKDTSDRSADKISRERETPPARTNGPSLHVDVQVHIGADASAEQIDQIFASMAKHLYPKQ